MGPRSAPAHSRAETRRVKKRKDCRSLARLQLKLDCLLLVKWNMKSKEVDIPDTERSMCIIVGILSYENRKSQYFDQEKWLLVILLSLVLEQVVARDGMGGVWLEQQNINSISLSRNVNLTKECELK